MKRAVLQASTPQRLVQLEAAVRRYLPELGASLVAFSDVEEASQWILMHEPALLMLERDGSGFVPLQLQRLREQWPMMHQLYLPEQLLEQHPANDIFARHAAAILKTERGGFVGTTAISSLIQLIQFIEYARLDGVLGVQRDGARMSTIGFVQGQIVSARHESAAGVEALRELLELSRGTFRWTSESVSERNIEAQTGARLLLELVRQRDERRWRAAGGLDDESSITLSAPPPEDEPVLLVKRPGGQSARSGTSSLIDARHNLPQRGFVGGFSLSQLVDVVQLHALTQSTGVLHVYYGLREAQIHLERGEVVHAICGRVDGESAFIMVMEVRQGSFMFAPQPVTMRTIRASLLSLLLGASDGARAGKDDDLWGGDGDLNLFGPMNTAQHRSLGERPGSDVFQRPAELGGELSEVMHRLHEEPGVAEALSGLDALEGFMWAALVSVRHGVLHLSQAAGGTLVASAIEGALRDMPGLLGATLKAGEALEDTMVITAGAYMLFRPMSKHRTTFMVLVLARKRTNLGLARLRLGAAEESLRALLLASDGEA
jgi:hypothetical protein